MIYRHRSDFIFNLAREFDIPLQTGQHNPLTDSDFELFKLKYLTLANYRDNQLKEYLNKTPSLFRVFIPNSDRAYKVAHQMMWYVDELLIRDPVQAVLTSKYKDIEEQKHDLIHNLKALHSQKNAVLSGIFLLHGPKLIDTDIQNIPNHFDVLLEDPEIYKGLVDAAYFGIKKTKSKVHGSKMFFQVKLDSGFLLGLKVEKIAKKGQVGTFKIGEDFPQVSPDEFFKLIGESTNELQGVFLTEIKRIINATVNANKLSSAIIFDRNIDGVILNRADAQISKHKQIANVSSINFVLPYLQNVSSDKLFELRMRLPNAFIDFRCQLTEIVSDILNKTDLSMEEIKFKFDKEIIRNTRVLESELNSELTKASVLGV